MTTPPFLFSSIEVCDDQQVSLRVVFLYLALLPLIHTSSRPQWVPANGPLAGRITAACTMGTDLIVAAYGSGVFISSDDGKHWTLVESRSDGVRLHALAVSGTNLVAGTENGILLSTNKGVNWIETSLHDGYITALARMEGFLFAGGLNGGVQVSTDHGLTWASVGGRLAQGSIYALAAGDSLLFAAANSGVIRSSDFGVTWDSTGLRRSDVIAIEVKGPYLFAGTYRGIFRSSDAGDSWTSATTGLTDTIIQCFSHNGTRLFTGTRSGGVCVSTDNGDRWTPFTTGLQDTAVFAFAVSESILYAGTNNGFFRSLADHAQWVKIGLSLGWVPVLLRDGARFYACASGYMFPSALYRSVDEGVDWLPFTKGLLFPVPEMLALVVNGPSIIAGTTSGVYCVIDSTADWASTSLDFTAVYALARSGTRLFAGTRVGGVYVSSDNGADWTPATTGLTNKNIYSLGSDGDTVFAGTGKGVFYSTDSGMSWGPFYSGLEAAEVHCLLLNGAEKYAGTQLGAFRAVDSSRSWIPVTDGLMSTDVRALAADGKNVFAGTYGGGAYLLAGGASAWTTVNEGLGSMDVNALVADGTNLLVGTAEFGIWRRPLSEMVTGVRKSPPVGTPRGYALHQNYPNPFNPVTQIRYSIPTQSFVVLKVYDVLGREIAVLVNEKKQPGEFVVQWDAGSVPSGVYFYRFLAGEYHETRKMLHLQ